MGGLFRLLETIPAEEVTPDVAVAALKLIINLDNHPFSTTIPFHPRHQNPPRGQTVTDLASTQQQSNFNMLEQGSQRMSETFLRFAFINMLLEIVYRSRDPKAIIEGNIGLRCLGFTMGSVWPLLRKCIPFELFSVGLEIVAKDPLTNSAASTTNNTVGNTMTNFADESQIRGSQHSIHSNYGHEGHISQEESKTKFPLTSQAAPSYKDKLYEETIELMTEGVFSLAQLCQVVTILSQFNHNHKEPVSGFAPVSKLHRLADKFWAGIMDKSDELNEDTMALVFKTLPHLKTRYRVIFNHYIMGRILFPGVTH